MAYVIAEPCGACKDRACVSVCPCNVIHEGRVEVGGTIYDQLFIYADECINCGLCEPECPVDAIFPGDELPEEWRKFKEINVRFFEARLKR